MLRSEAIQSFLYRHNSWAANLYHAGMECQVSVRPIGRSDRPARRGKSWWAYLDGETRIESYHIPAIEPGVMVDTDTENELDMDRYVKFVGLTGWDFRGGVTKWIGFDIDPPRLPCGEDSKAVLDRVKNALLRIDWVNARRSTNDRGLHLFIFLPDLPASSWTTHRQWGDMVRNELVRECGFDITPCIDGGGGKTLSVAGDSLTNFDLVREATKETPWHTRFNTFRSSAVIPEAETTG